MAVEGTLRVEGELAPGATPWSGDGRTYRLLAFTRTRGAAPAGARDFTAGGEWSEVVVPLAELGTDGGGVTALVSSAAGAPGAFRFELDDVRLLPRQP